MGAPDLLHALHAMGLRLSVHGVQLHVAPRTAITDEARRLIRTHKAELLAALQRSADQGDTLPDPAAESRRQRVLAMLADYPDKQRAVYCDGEPVNGVVTIYVAIRYTGGIATAAIEVRADRYDGMALLDLIQKHSGTVH